MTGRPPRAAATALTLASASAAVFVAAARPGPLGPLVLVAAALLASALRTAPSRTVRAASSAVAALGPASVAVAPLAPLAPLAALPAALLVAAPFAAIGVTVRPAAGGAPTVRGAAWIASVWSALEAGWGSTTLLGMWALPTMAVGSSLADGPGITLAGWVGVRGMSWLAIATGASLAAIPGAATRAAVTVAAVAALAAPTWAAPAAAAVAPATSGSATRSGDAIPVRLVQTALTPTSIAALRFDPARERAHAAFLREHARGAADQGRLVVWPEAVLPRPLRLDEPSARPALVPADADVLFGAATRRDGGLFNSALLWRGGRLTIVADKIRLVPLTEAALTPGTPRPPAAWRDRRVAALICWEAVFPASARRLARAGADLLAILANDAYAGDGPVPRLHLRMARLRAAEVGLPVVFAQATGPSAAIAADGRVVGRLPAGRAGSLDVDLPSAAGATLYRRTGDLVGPGASLACLLIVARRLRHPGDAARRGGGA